MSETGAVLAGAISRDALVAELRALRSVFERNALTHMALVGSRARQDHRDESDIDLLVDVNPDLKFSLVEIARIMRAIEDRTGLPAHIMMRRSLSPRLLEAASRDQIPVF